MNASDTSTDALARLEVRIRQNLALLGEPPDNWVPPRPEWDVDVAIVGAGQSGLAVAFGLQRAGIRNIQVLDAAPAGREGPWITWARMEVLRSPKEVPGPELGMGELTFRAWHEASHGADAYSRFAKIAKDDWMAYLDWYRRMIQVPIRNDTRVSLIEPLAGGGLRLSLETASGVEHLPTRKLVLANGMDGAGGPQIPALMAHVERRFWAHSADEVDFERLRGRQVAVLGAASSAFDNAATALERGAARVDLYCRSAHLTRVNRFKGASYPGTLDHFPDLPDDLKWRVMHDYFREATPPTRETVQRCTRHGNFQLHLGSPWERVAVVGEELRIHTPGGEQRADFAILGTGFACDFRRRPEYRYFAEQVACWRDRYTPPPGLENPTLGSFPYQGAGYQLLEREPGSAPWLADIHGYFFASIPSLGRAAGETGSLKHGVPRLVNAIGRDLFLADAALHVERMLGFEEPELSDEEMAAVEGLYARVGDPS